MSRVVGLTKFKRRDINCVGRNQRLQQQYLVKIVAGTEFDFTENEFNFTGIE